MKALTPDETLLGLLAANARHGYDLLDCFRPNHELGRVWHMSTSQIYAVLKRLEQQGWIVGQIVETENAPPRTEYSLTESGKARLLSWLHEQHPSASIRCIRVEFLSRLFVAQQLGLPTANIIQRQRMMCRQKHLDLIAERSQSSGNIDALALDLHIAQLEAILQWMDHCETVERNTI